MTKEIWAEALTLQEGVLRAEVIERTLLVTLHRPEVANALDTALMDALTRLWEIAAQTTELRCIVVTGAKNAFCSGADASMLSGNPRPPGDTASDELSFVPGPRVSVPVITLVNGVCAGGGLHFVADADICLASSDARFLDPHVSVGQVSALEPLLLRLRARHDVVARMVLLGRHEKISAQDALTAGLVSEVTEPEHLLARGLELAALIAMNSPEAVRLSRRVIRTFEERLLATDLDLGWELIQRHRSHPDAVEGPRAFLEKRGPAWVESR